VRGKSCLIRLLAGLGLSAAFLGILFAAYAWRVANSPFLLDLAARGSAYPCIEAILDPSRPRDRVAGHLATVYLLDGSGGTHPSLTWHARRYFATLAIEAAFRQSQVNRMAASTRISRFQGFDDVSLAKTGRRYCALDETARAAVTAYYRGPSEARLRAVAASPRR